jgi:hypothetical protein
MIAYCRQIGVISANQRTSRNVLAKKIMIIETIVSTLDETGRPNFAPMGVLWDEEFATVRAYRDTRTCRNLMSTGYGVVNISDNVLAYVQCGLYDAVLPHFQARVVPGVVFDGCCSWREIEVIARNGSEERAELRCRVLHEGRQRDFLGFCRAGNAVIEAVILATRLHLYDRQTLMQELVHYRTVVEKTGDATQKRAFQMVEDYIEKRRSDD